MLRNREIRRFAVCLLGLTVIGEGAVFLLLGSAAGAAVGIMAVFYGAAFFLFTGKRYRRIARMSEHIDLVLHGQDRLYPMQEEEGELSILQSELSKMTLRIREQNAALQKEKEHLADALADIAHQLRTPLTSISLVLSLLEHHPGEEKQKELFAEAEELLIRIDSLVTCLLKISRLDAGIVTFQRADTDVGKLIDTSLRPFLISMDLHSITVQMRIPKETVISCDPDWTAQAIQNILKNCIESAGDQGWIEIFCEDTPLFVELKIHDSGAGFAEEDIPFIFDRFYQGQKGQTSGYGIGLALSRSIITGQNGTITARNHLQGGAVFTIRFPK